MKKFIVLDTETAPVCRMTGDFVNPQMMRVYDLGWIVADEQGNIYEQVSLIIDDTFDNEKMMNSAYYADKLPAYRTGRGTVWQSVSFVEAWQMFNNSIKEHNISSVWAYNCKFDKASLNATINDYSNGFISEFIPAKMWCDIWDYAGSTICNTKKFVKYCLEHDYFTIKGNPTTKAENVYRYITGKEDFAESHTALEDCKIELAILLKAKKRHQKARHTIGRGWVDAANIKKNL